MTSEKRFGYEWDKWSKEKELMPEFEEQFLDWIDPLDKQFINNKRILNAGCGFSRHSLFCLNYGAKEVVSFDNDDKSVNASRELLKEHPNARVYKESIYDIKYENEFDFVFAIGVLHHLEFPEEAMSKLKRSLRKNGTLLIMVYSKEGNKLLREISFIRGFTSLMPLPLLKTLTLIPAGLLYMGLRLNLLKHQYYQVIRNYNFKHIHMIVFDHLIPEINDYYAKEEVLELMKGLRDVYIKHSKGKCWVAMGKFNPNGG